MEDQSRQSGEQAAGDTASGAVFGAMGLVGFAAMIWQLSTKLPAWLVLLLAMIAWLVVGISFWWLYQKITKGRD